MKIQDILFLLAFLYVVWLRRPTIAVSIGLVLLLISIPLFGFWIFFTAERLVWYAAGLFLLTIVLQLNALRKEP